MISSKDILEATGLKSGKTLTRWYQRALIPEPLVRTHPSGRGKMAYWPDWVLDRCVRIVELQKEGHSLESAARVLEAVQWNRTVELFDSQPESISDLLAEVPRVLGAGIEGTQLDLFLLAILASLKHLIIDGEERRVLLAKLREEKAVDTVLNLARAGYNPVLMYDGEDLAIIPDFLVGQRLSEELPPMKSFYVAPVLPTLRDTFPTLDKVIGASPAARPAPKVWVHDGDAVVEYLFYPAGIIGFELIRETARVVSTLPRKAGSNANEAS